MKKHSKIFVAGGQTLTGAALLRYFRKNSFVNVVGKNGEEPDLTDASAVTRFFKHQQPEFVFLTGGKSGGILANQNYPAELMLDNLLIECNVIQNAFQFGTKKLFYLASSCSYPKDSQQPIPVEALLTGALEPTNEAYAVAKIAGIKLCQAFRHQHQSQFIVGVPSNPFGPGDDFSRENSHVIPALIRKIHEARIQNSDSVDIWGTGSPRRDFIFVDDLTQACLFLMENYDSELPINIGNGTGITIKELAELIKDVVGFTGELIFDPTKPDGMPVKILDSEPLTQLGWQPPTPFREALEQTYRWYLETIT